MKISQLMIALLTIAIQPQLTAQEQDTKVQITTVAQNGMPRNIVSPGAQWNFGPGSLWSHRGWQYAAYWDENRQVSIARRQLPADSWETISLPGYQRTKNINRGTAGPKSQGFGDGHEKVSLGISPDGIIHLAFDHHVSTLHYRTSKSGIANDPAKHSWHPDLFGPVIDNLGGSVIDKVTYPSFATDGKQFTLYLRLNGGSGSGDSHLFDYADGQWLTPDPTDAKLIDKNWSGGDKTVNAYPHTLVIQNGRRHLTWCWRDTPDAKTCHDLCYAYSDDQGQTWKNNAGEVIGHRGKKFITADSPRIAAIKIPPGSSFVNGGSMTVDTTGRVHVLMRGEKRRPAYFTRNPKTNTWSRKETDKLAQLIPSHNQLYLVSEDGLWKTPTVAFGEFKKLSSGHDRHFKDSKAALDKYRADGWISLIGQNGKTVSVIDFQIK